MHANAPPILVDRFVCLDHAVGRGRRDAEQLGRLIDAHVMLAIDANLSGPVDAVHPRSWAIATRTPTRGAGPAAQTMTVSALAALVTGPAGAPAELGGLALNTGRPRGDQGHNDVHSEALLTCKFWSADQVAVPVVWIASNPPPPTSPDLGRPATSARAMLLLLQACGIPRPRQTAAVRLSGSHSIRAGCPANVG